MAEYESLMAAERENYVYRLGEKIYRKLFRISLKYLSCLKI